jgi:hypothetical protein
MAITRVGAVNGITGADPTSLGLQAGDLLVAFAYRDGNNAAPGLASDWNNIANSGANTNSARIAFKYATGPTEGTATWSNATSVVIVVYRGTGQLGIGASSLTGGNSTIINYPALTLTGPEGNSWILGFAGHRSVNTALELPPSGMTNFIVVLDDVDEAVAHDTNGPVTSWSGDTVQVGGTSQGWRSATIEITEELPLAVPVNTVAPAIVGQPIIGSSLSVTTGTWEGEEPITFTYRWRRNGVNTTTTTATFPVFQPRDVGEVYDCVVTATNSLGSTTAVSNSVTVEVGFELVPFSEIRETFDSSLGVYFEDVDVTLEAGRVRLNNVTASVTYGSISTAVIYNFKNTSIVKEVEWPTDYLTARFGSAHVGVTFPAITNSGFYLLRASNVNSFRISFKERKSAATTNIDFTANFADVRFVRLQENNNTISISTSPDNLTWTERDSRTANFRDFPAASEFYAEDTSAFYVYSINSNPPNSPSINPSTIMGENALSWIDVTKGEMFQDTAGTVPAGIGDPVRFVSDGTGSAAFLHPGGTVNPPILRDGYLEFNQGFLRKAVTRPSGALGYGIRVRTPSGLSGTIHRPLVVGGTLSEWYANNPFSIDLNGFLGGLWISEPGIGGLSSTVGSFDSLQTRVSATGVARFARNGEQHPNEPTGISTAASNLVYLGGAGYNFGTQEADPGRFDVVRYYVLDAVPTPEQEAALLEWLENGDPGVEETGTIINYWSGATWLPGELKRWSGDDWLPARLKRRTSSSTWEDV